MISRHARARMSAMMLGISLLALAACAHQPRRRVGVNIEHRPTPVQPDSSGQVATTGSRRPQTIVMTPHTLHTTIASIAEDTLAARAALDRCRGRKLLPDQEGVYDSTTQILMQVRDALAMVDFNRARALAREARQLATSMGCR